MDIDHEARKHDVHPATIKGEADRVKAEDRSEKVRDVLNEAKESVGDSDEVRDDAANQGPDTQDPGNPGPGSADQDRHGARRDRAQDDEDSPSAQSHRAG